MKIMEDTPVLEVIPRKTPSSVFSSERQVKTPKISKSCGLEYNKRLEMEGLNFLSKLDQESATVAFLDPQYRGVLDHLQYGNEGKKRGKARSSLPQMKDQDIHNFIKGIDRALIPSGHLFLWLDKFHFCTGFSHWLEDTKLEIVDLITWDKQRIGMGYRTRRKCEYLVVLQKFPKRAKGVWTAHNIPDVWQEKVRSNGHTHSKPIELQARLIEAVSNKHDVVIDPAAGSFSVLSACEAADRTFLGCDIIK